MKTTFEFIRYFYDQSGPVYDLRRKSTGEFVQLFGCLYDTLGAKSFTVAESGIYAIFDLEDVDKLDSPLLFKRRAQTTFLGTLCWIVKLKKPKHDSLLASFFYLLERQSKRLGEVSRLVNLLEKNLGAECTVNFLYKRRALHRGFALKNTGRNEVIPIICVRDTFVKGSPRTIVNPNLVEIPASVVSEVFKQDELDKPITHQFDFLMEQLEYKNDWSLFTLVDSLKSKLDEPCSNVSEKILRENKYNTLLSLAKRLGYKE